VPNVPRVEVNWNSLLRQGKSEGTREAEGLPLSKVPCVAELQVAGHQLLRHRESHVIVSEYIEDGRNAL